MANDARAKRREFLKMAATGAASVGVLSHSSFAAETGANADLKRLLLVSAASVRRAMV